MKLSFLKVHAGLLIIFSSLFLAAAPAYSQAAGAFRLIGTIEGARGFTGAVLDDNSGTQTFYRLRETLPDGSRIVKIGTDTILIKRSDGSSHELFVVQTSKPGSTPTARPGNQVPPPSPVAAEPTGQAREPQPDRLNAASGRPAPGLRGTGNGGDAERSKSKRSREWRRNRRSVEE